MNNLFFSKCIWNVSNVNAGVYPRFSDGEAPPQGGAEELKEGEEGEMWGKDQGWNKYSVL